MELDLKSERRIYEAGVLPSAEIGLALITRLEQAEQDRVKLRNRLDAMRRQRDGYQNQIRKTEPTKEKTMPDTPLNPDAIKAARLVYGGLTECEAASDCDECQVEAGEIIRAYLAVAQPELQANSKPNQNFEVVNSVEELNALPIGTVVYANNHIGPAERFHVGWMGCGNTAAWSSAVLAGDGLPARVLYRPEVKP